MKVRGGLHELSIGADLVSSQPVAVVTTFLALISMKPYESKWGLIKNVMRF